MIKTHFWNNDFTKSETWQTPRRKKWLKITWLLLYNQPLTLVPRDTEVYLKGQVHEFKTQIKFFSIGFSFRDTGNSQDSGEREETMFYSSLPVPPAHELSGLYLKLCMWDDYHIFLTTSVVTPRLPLDEIYHHIWLPFDPLMLQYSFVCLLDDLILGFW